MSDMPDELRSKIEEGVRKHFDEVPSDQIHIVEGTADFASLHKLMHVVCGIAAAVVQTNRDEGDVRGASDIEVLGMVTLMASHVIEEKEDNHKGAE